MTLRPAPPTGAESADTVGRGAGAPVPRADRQDSPIAVAGSGLGSLEPPPVRPARGVGGLGRGQ